MRPIDADALRDEWLFNGLNEKVYNANDFLDSIDDQPTIDPVKHRTYSKNEMIECLAQIGQRYGDVYMTMFGCTCDVKTYVNRIMGAL